MQGGNPSVHDRDVVEMYCLHYAAMKGHQDALDTLVALGTTLNISSGTGDGTVQYAAEEGQIVMIQKLVQMGLGMDTLGFCNTTAAFSTVEKGQLEALKVLIELGASVSVSFTLPP
jgi:hypothetical protein